MYQRYTDYHRPRREHEDFVKRRHTLPLWLVGLMFAAALVVIAVIVHLPWPSRYYEVAAIAACVVTLFLVVGYCFHRLNDVIMATEFQNALFASAARSHTEFCILMTQEGNIVYADTGFYKYFTPPKRRGQLNIDILMQHEGLSHEAKLRLQDAMQHGTTEHLVMRLPTSGTTSPSLALKLEPLVVHPEDMEGMDPDIDVKLDPINRPFGFFYLRGVKDRHIHEYQTIMHRLNIGFYAVNEEQQLLRANRTFLDMFGYTAEEINEGKISLADIMFGGMEDHEDTLPNQWSGEIILKKKDGTPVCTFLNQVTIDNELPRITRRYGLVVPLSVGSDEILTANATSPRTGDPLVANALEEGWHSLLEPSPIATALLDASGNITKSNKAFLLLTGKTPEAGRDWNLLEIIEGENKQEVSELFRKALTGGESSHGPVDIKISGTSGFTAYLYVSRMGSISSNHALIAHLIDSTEQKNLELRFVHSQKMQAVGQLAGGIAHDFNNLLTAMIGFCDLLLMRHPPGDASFADIMQVKQNANRAANLVRQLLAFSRKQTLHPEVIDISEVLADLSNLLRRLIGENIELQISHARNLGLIKVDEGQFEQVIINLAVNARDAMQKGGTLMIQTSNVTVNKDHPVSRELIPPAEDEIIADGEYVMIEVIDSGHGIPREIVGKIFEPFFSTKEVGSGTGLGLSTVYGIVKQTGGYIYVTSKEGEGTTFTIFLKRYYAEAASQASKVHEHESAEKPVNLDLTGQGKILLVEDEAPVRTFSAKALSQKGYTLLEADCAESALEIVQKRGHELDMIITDVIMPGMNGPTMIEEVRKTYPNIKVIFISGYAEDAFRNTYGAERSFNFLPKPYTLKQLAGKVKEVMTG